jgi:peptidoglycan hydrolase-like protein with peptidoglycan-binding domain
MGEGAQPWIRPGNKGPNVETLQNRLNAIGGTGTPVAVTATYDPPTVKAVKAFQTASGLDDDGIVGPLTSEAMDRKDAKTAEVVTAGTDVTGTADRPTDTEISAIDQALNPTSGGGGTATPWDGAKDKAKAKELDDAVSKAMQDFLDKATPKMKEKEEAKKAGRVLSTKDQEGGGRQAKRAVDALLGQVASAAVLTKGQEAGRAAFSFKAGVNLLDASDPAVRRPDPADAADWIFETDDESQKAQKAHGFNQHRTGQGEPTFAEGVKGRFVAKGANKTDLTRLDQFAFAVAQPGPRVLKQIATVDSPGFSATAPAGQMSDAERRQRWAGWEVLVHEYIHTLEHPNFGRASRGNRILIEGFCELFTKDVLFHHKAIENAKADADPSVRKEIEGGDVPKFDAKFVPDYTASEYQGYLDQAEKIRAQVGEDATRAAFFLGHVEHIGLKPTGEMIDPKAPDAAKFLAPEKVVIPDVIRSVSAVSILTGAPEADILKANPSLSASGPLPSDAHAAGLVVPGTTQHRVLQVTDRSGAAVTESREAIAKQHGLTEHALQRANPKLNHRQPTPGEWVLIPVRA